MPSGCATPDFAARFWPAKSRIALQLLAYIHGKLLESVLGLAGQLLKTLVESRLAILNVVTVFLIFKPASELACQKAPHRNEPDGQLGDQLQRLRVGSTEPRPAASHVLGSRLLKLSAGIRPVTALSSPGAQQGMSA